MPFFSGFGARSFNVGAGACFSTVDVSIVIVVADAPSGVCAAILKSVFLLFVVVAVVDDVE